MAICGEPQMGKEGGGKGTKYSTPFQNTSWMIMLEKNLNENKLYENLKRKYVSLGF